MIDHSPSLGSRYRTSSGRLRTVSRRSATLRSRRRNCSSTAISQSVAGCSWNPREAFSTLMVAGSMENEELAALRATLLAAQRQPLAVKVRQARLSALLADGDELLPYVLSRSCSDPRDR